MKASEGADPSDTGKRGGYENRRNNESGGVDMMGAGIMIPFVLIVLLAFLEEDK